MGTFVWVAGGQPGAERLEFVARWLIVTAFAELIPYMIAVFVGLQSGRTPALVELFGQGQLYLSGITMGVAALAENFATLMQRGRVAERRVPLLFCVFFLLILLLLMTAGYAETVTSETAYRTPLPKTSTPAQVASVAEKNESRLNHQETRTTRFSIGGFTTTLVTALVLVFAV